MDDSTEDFPTKSFALTGKVMLITIVFLFSVMIIMIFLHLYIRWYLSRLRLRRRGSRSRRRSRLIFYAFDDGPTSPSPRGLDPYVLASIPVFPYSRGDRTVPTDCGELECAVCLSEFEGGEKVRLLPKCGHCFHVECIDMWFHSHSTCPLCRLPVEPPPPEENVSCVGGPGRPEPDSSSGPCVACSTSTGHRRKDFAVGRVTIEVPRRTGFENDIETSSPASSGFRSPAARLLSLTRILSMSRRSAAVSPSAGVGSSRDPVAAGELDLEGGRDESTQQQTWTRTPR